MKKFLFTSAMFITSMASYCQTQNELDIFNRERNRITRKGMIVLGGWSAANLIYSGVATGQTSGTNKYFHQMNVAVSISALQRLVISELKTGMDQAWLNL